MPKGIKKVKEVEVIEEVLQDEVVEDFIDTPEVSSKKEISVYEGGRLIRTYSKVEHGDNFKELANNFISDRPTYSLK